MNDLAQSPAQSTELVVLPTGNALEALFKAPTEMDAILDRIEAEVRSHVPDLSTAKGRAAVASLAAKVARSKTALDGAGKALNEDARAQINAVDAERRKIRDRLDALKEEARRPLTEWEAAEEKRIAGHRQRIESLSPDRVPLTASASQIAEEIARIEAVEIGDAWDEFAVEAAQAKDGALRTLRVRHAETQKREEEQAELARLRKAEEERQAREAEEARAKAAAEEAERREREKREAAEAAAKEAEARAAREKQEAEERHARELAEAQAAAERAREEERKAAEARAAEEERKRQEAARAAEAEAEARRKDEENRRRVFEDINRALVPLSKEQIARALINGEIPHVVVRF